MQVDGSGRYGSFDVYRPLLSPVRGDGTVMVRSAGRTQVLPAMTEADRKAARRGSSEREGWDFGVRGRVGVLTMPTWSMYNSKWNWRAFIDAAVDRLIDERLRGLVVDLRDNEGGEDCGDHLLKRLIDRPLPSARFRRFVRYRRAPATLTPYLGTWDKSFRDWGEAAQPSDRPGFFRLRSNDRGDDDDLIAPAGRRFTGKVAVLVSATCSSATFQFAQLVKQSGVARLIGTPTGGNQRGINGGAYFFLRLPATGTEVDLPLIGFFPDGPRPDAGITPDLVVTPTVRDIAGGRDRQMASALAWAG